MIPFEVPRADLVASLAARAGGPPFLLTGPPGAGKSWLLRALGRRLREEGALPVSFDLFAAASSPDRFVAAVLAGLPAGPLAESLAAATRLRVLAESGREHGAEAVRALFDLVASLRDTASRRLVFLFDDATEIRSLAYFQGLREVHHPFLEALARRGGGAVLATSFATQARRLWPSLSAVEVPPVGPGEVQAAWPGAEVATAAALQALTGGWPRYLRILWPRVRAGEAPLEAWLAEMAPGALLEHACRHTFERLLLRSRGYGMSKAVLAAVAREEGLNLTALVARVGRTPGATRDYLQWLVDVDALRREGKRYFFVDPVVRAWVVTSARPHALRGMAEELSRRGLELPGSQTQLLSADAHPHSLPGEGGTPEEAPLSRRDSLMEID